MPPCGMDLMGGLGLRASIGIGIALEAVSAAVAGAAGFCSTWSTFAAYLHHRKKYVQYNLNGEHDYGDAYYR